MSNPYREHSQLSELEQSVLWEYAKLNEQTKRITAMAQAYSTDPHDRLLAKLRDLEKRMGLVLTLFKGSVWAVLQENTPDI